jgi:hypothetical protein
MNTTTTLLLVCSAMLLPIHLASANAPAGRYTIGGGTVYDTKTKLTWQQSVPSGTYTPAGAKAYCTSTTVNTTLGGSGWRLPTVKELLTLEDFSQASAPLIDPSAFPGTPAEIFWSSTPVVGMASNAWFVDFNEGGADFNGVPGTGGVRCVR